MSRVKLVLSVAVIAGCSGGKTPPPFGVPITGGTLHVTGTGHAVISDPDRDRIVTVDLATDAIVGELPLTAGDEPGRVIEDGAGRLHVALRRGGSILTLADATSGTITASRFACAEPRGLAWDAATDSIHVACTGGELVTFPAAGGDATRRLRLDRDLRDVVVSGGQLVVTRFRSSELLTIDTTGAVVQRLVPPPVFRFSGGLPFLGPLPSDGLSGEAIASTAWRTLALADGRVLVSHQRTVGTVLDTERPGGYGGSCDSSPVEAAVSLLVPGQAPIPLEAIARGALPVDLALSPGETKIAVVLAGQKTVTVMDTALALTRPDRDRCGPDDDDDDDDDQDLGEDLGAPTSAAFAKNGDLVIFYPEKPALVVRAADGVSKRLIPLTGELSLDPGRAIFHGQTRLQLACASCHPEGRDDGRVWHFAQTGPRRTQSLAGDLLSRAPFHWSGDMTSLDVLMDDVFAVRMGGGEVTRHQKVALAAWLDRIPAPAPGPTADEAAVARGRAIFESSEAACATCHNGALLTNNLLVDVGTGDRFKVPSLLGVGARAPFMHDGCAATLADRFGPLCGGGDAHGRTSHLTAAQIADLVAYLESI
jgi:mono/diheme cytochrome c family protein/DNA-binding beta-propeller fold protein YncE